jgi:hypothetical protein
MKLLHYHAEVCANKNDRKPAWSLRHVRLGAFQLGQSVYHHPVITVKLPLRREASGLSF